MRSIKSSECESKAHAVVSVFSYDLRRAWSVPALFLLSLLMSCPVACLLVTEPGKDRLKFLESMGDNRYALPTFFFCIMAIATGVGVYQYVQKSRLSNFIHSLPVTRERLFTANYVTGLMMLFVPITITALVTMLFGVEQGGMIRWMLLSWLVCAVIYAVTVLAGMVSGTVFMHVFNSLFFLFIVVMLLMVVDEYAEMLLYGYTQPQIMEDIFKKAVPFVALYGKPSAMTIILYIVIWAILSFLAGLIYKRRAIENTGDSLVFSWTKSLIIGVVVFVGTCFMGAIFRLLTGSMSTARMNAALIIGMAFGFVASFLVISLIVYKGSKIFGRQNLVTAGIVVIVTALFAGSMAMDVTGYEKKCFDPDSISTIAATGITGGYDARFDAEYFKVDSEIKLRDFDGNTACTLKDRDNIKAVCDIQKTLVDVGKEKRSSSVDYESDVVNITVSATSVSGKVMSRSYINIDRSTLELINKEMATVFESNEFKEMFALSNLRNRIDSVYIHRSTDVEYEHDVELPEAKIDALAEAIDLDFGKETFEQYEKANDLFQSEKPQEKYYEITLNFESGTEGAINVIVTEDYENTWRWIQENIEK